MITLHARRGRVSIVILQEESNKVSQLIAQLAEILVETKQASFEEVELLRIALQKKDGSWQEITEAKASTLGELNIDDNTNVGYALGDGDFGFEDVDPDLTE